MLTLSNFLFQFEINHFRRNYQDRNNMKSELEAEKEKYIILLELHLT